METRIHSMNLLPAEKVVTEIALLLQQAIVGYRFHPTEEELINYLKSKVTGCRESFCIIPTLENIYKIDPWDLPDKFNEKSIIRSNDQEWWFICPQMQNQRISRKTPCGCSWKITGKHKEIKAKNDDKRIGSKITLVFLDGRNSKGTTSNWVMHEFHPHPDDTGFVLCFLKKKQDEKEDSKSDGSHQNQTKSLAPIQEDNHHSSPNLEHLMWTKNYSSTENSSGRGLAVCEPTNDELNFPHPVLNVDVCSAIEAEREKQRKADSVYSLEEKVDEMSGTSNFIGEQADKSWDGMDCDAPEQLPFAEHRVQEVQNKLTELIMNGSSCSTETSSGSGITLNNERSRTEAPMSPLDHDSFLNGELFDYYSLLSETEADIGVIQYGQYGKTNWENSWAQKNQRPVCDTLEGAVPLEEEKGFAEQKLNHPYDTEKIITECAPSDGVPAKEKAQAAEFKEMETTMIQPQKKDDVKIESDNISLWETWNDLLSPTRPTASTSCCHRNKSTIDPAVRLAMIFALVLLVVCVIVDGICRISDGVNQTMQHRVFFRGFDRRF